MHHRSYRSSFLNFLCSYMQSELNLRRKNDENQSKTVIFQCIGLQTAVFLMPCVCLRALCRDTWPPCSSTLMSVIICNLLICRDDNNPATCLPDYQCIMLRLYSEAFQRFAFMQQAETRRSANRPSWRMLLFKGWSWCYCWYSVSLNIIISAF